MSVDSGATTSLPREGFRLLVPGGGVVPGLELRAAEGDGESADPVMFGHFSVFDTWTEIDSFFEGNFMERVAKGAYKKTFREQRASMQSLFQHGKDPQIGSKPLGPIDELKEDDTGAYYEVSLLDAPYVRDTLLPGLRAGLYGASFRFRVMREEIVDEPQPSEFNPRGIPERTIKEAQVYEFGPVTFPAYPEATAGVRSYTDEYFIDSLAAAEPEVVRWAMSARSDFAEFLSRRTGVDLSAVRSATGEQTNQQDNEDTERGRPPEPSTDKPAKTRKAAPELQATTPLLGVRKEPWRL